jgi:hypothetical protein
MVGLRSPIDRRFVPAEEIQSAPTGRGYCIDSSYDGDCNEQPKQGSSEPRLVLNSCHQKGENLASQAVQKMGSPDHSGNEQPEQNFTQPCNAANAFVRVLSQNRRTDESSPECHTITLSGQRYGAGV